MGNRQMNKALGGRTLGLVLCEMFGIDPANVVGLEVKAYVGKPAEVEIITRPVLTDGCTVSQTFKLMKNSDGEL
jgi:hypothetical protein